MIGRNFSIGKQRAKYVIMDFVMSSIAFFVFNLYRFSELDINSLGDILHFLGTQKMLLEQIIVPFGLLGLFYLSGYYNRPFDKSRVSELTQTLASAIAATIILYLVLLINDSTGLKLRDYLMIIALFGSIFTFVYIGRAILTFRTIRYVRKRKWIYSTLIIGNSKRSRDVYDKLIKAGSAWAYNVIGFIRLPNEIQVEDRMPTWDFTQVEEICRRHDIDQIVLAPEVSLDTQIMEILERLFPLDIPVKIAPDMLSYITGNIRLNDILGIPLIDLTSPRISEFQKNVKRVFDILASAVGLIATSPVLLISAIIVKATSPGKVIYSQVRLGKGHRPFRIYKLRSMCSDAEKGVPQLSSDSDIRITRFGRFMRKYRIDELPQFWNVLRGDMSIVGPRPEREYFVEKIMKEAPYYCLIFQIRPGITSWGMVKYGYASTIDEMVDRSRYDLIYLNNMSISTDVKIMIYTVRTVLKGKGK